MWVQIAIASTSPEPSSRRTTRAGVSIPRSLPYPRDREWDDPDPETIKRLPTGIDAIVLGDVLEHLRDPSALLRLVHDSIGAKGRAFISVPNIANITVRLGLLLGVFEYRDRGILDNTHLRFYTMRTIRRQIETAGFRILAVRGSSVPIRLIVGFTPGSASDITARLFAKGASDVLGQQVVVENKPGAAGSLAGQYVAHAP